MAHLISNSVNICPLEYVSAICRAMNGEQHEKHLNNQSSLVCGQYEKQVLLYFAFSYFEYSHCVARNSMKSVFVSNTNTKSCLESILSLGLALNS